MRGHNKTEPSTSESPVAGSVLVEPPRARSREAHPELVRAPGPGQPTRTPAQQAAFLAGLVALAHGINDAYAAFLSPLLPRIMEKMGLSIALAATLAMTLSLGASLLQPLMGYLADRYGRRLFVVLGPLLSGVFLSMVGLAPTFWILVAFLLLGGLGSATFHPPGASYAARISEGKGSGLRMSFFSLGGSLGWAAGPLIAVAIVGSLGLEGLWVAMFPGILLAVLLWHLLPPRRADRTPAPPPSPVKVLNRLGGPLGLLMGISVVGAFAQRVYLTMEPIVVARSGGSDTSLQITRSAPRSRASTAGRFRARAPSMRIRSPMR